MGIKVLLLRAAGVFWGFFKSEEATSKPFTPPF